MSISEIIRKKQLLIEQLDALEAELSLVKEDAIKEITICIKELNITFIEMEKLYRSAGLSTALVQVIPPKGGGIADFGKKKKNHPYFCKKTNRWYTGYNKIPSWFNLEQADSYLLPGRTHTKLIKEALEQRGLGGENKLMRISYTAAHIASFKDRADQLNKLYQARNFDLLDHKRLLYHSDLKEILGYCDDAVVEYFSNKKATNSDEVNHEKTQQKP